MKKIYEKPVVTIQLFSHEQVLTSSGFEQSGAYAQAASALQDKNHTFTYTLK